MVIILLVMTINGEIKIWPLLPHSPPEINDIFLFNVLQSVVALHIVHCVNNT